MVKWAPTLQKNILEFKNSSEAGQADLSMMIMARTIIVTSRGGSIEIREHYIDGDSEPIESVITEANALHNHVLGLVSTEPGIRSEDVVTIFMDKAWRYAVSER